MSERSGGKV